FPTRRRWSSTAPAATARRSPAACCAATDATCPTSSAATRPGKRRSAEQALADVTAASCPGRADEDRARGVHGEGTERVAGGEPALDRDELARIAHEREEEQAAVEQVAAAVDRALGEALRIVVTAAQDALSAVRLGGGEADVSMRWDHRRPDRVDRAQVDRVVLAQRPQRCAAGLPAPDRLLLRGKPRGVPGRKDDLDPADDHVGPAGQPAWSVARLDPDEAIEGLIIRSAEVVRAVLEADQVAWGAGARGRDEAGV